ncbi:hypothetical protein J437_LFUL004975 [Ladona fulva]|uniref:Ig-like domain-containing protein n=1 Tax=Ladona fulva TaxID=123851 RepID=A0A8K0NVT7_LADFU|nr:hypothetical protein J437_LFUL004975 [Ladona fulva]
MSGNNLQILPREAFVRASLLNLQKAFLRDCRLGQIDQLAFSGLTNLVELDLSGNLLTAVPSLTYVPYLRELSLARNPIQKIDSKAFKDVPNLVKLDLSKCELRTLAQGAFDGLDLLSNLRLDSNHLSEMRPRTVETLRKLSEVTFHENPWHCDCRLRPLRDWLAAANVAILVQPTCAEPRRLAYRELADIDPDDLACRPEMLIPPRWRVVEAPAGGNISLSCRAGGVPTPALFWAWGGRPVLDGTTLGPAGLNSRVIVKEEDSGLNERRSTLYLPDAREGESAEFTCVAQNKAGSAEANFSLRVTPATAGVASLGSGQIVGLGAALVILVLFILLLVFMLLIRLRRSSSSSSKTPTPGSEGGSAVASNGKSSGSGGIPGTAESDAVSGSKSPESRAENGTNAVQKPPRSTDIPYTTNHYDGGGSVMCSQGYVPSRGVTNSAATALHRNPDLVPEGDMAIGGEENPSPTGVRLPGRSTEVDRGLPRYSAEWERTHPGRVWESGTEAAPDGHEIRRAVALCPSSTGASFERGIDASDRTPIIGEVPGSAHSDQEEEDDPRTEPVSRYDHGAYPPDYGLPVLPPQITTPDAKTLRVWQRGVPVLPPVTALKRVLGSRDSPDEGYQEGCATDV